LKTVFSFSFYLQEDCKEPDRILYRFLNCLFLWIVQFGNLKIIFIQSSIENRFLNLLWLWFKLVYHKTFILTPSGPRKALVLSFHGWTGGGKNYVAQFVAESLFKWKLFLILNFKIVVESTITLIDFLNEFQLQRFRRFSRNLF
jgi:hypothetical protein